MVHDGRTAHGPNCFPPPPYLRPTCALKLAPMPMSTSNTIHTTSAATERTGGCLCGAVRFRISAEPVVARICWCRDCQHIASNGTANAIFPSSALHISGELAEHVRAADSGNHVRRRFCAQCGSHLFADSTGRAGFTVVRIGTLDAPSAISPSSNIWAASAPGWACLDPALARDERQPAPLPAAPR